MDKSLQVPAWFGPDTTKTRAAFNDLLNIHDRPENAGVEAPAGVEALRGVNDSLHRIEKKLDGMSEKQAGILRGLWQALWKGAGTVKAEGDKLIK